MLSSWNIKLSLLFQALNAAYAHAHTHPHTLFQKTTVDSLQLHCNTKHNMSYNNDIDADVNDDDDDDDAMRPTNSTKLHGYSVIYRLSTLPCNKTDCIFHISTLFMFIWSCLLCPVRSIYSKTFIALHIQFDTISLLSVNVESLSVWWAEWMKSFIRLLDLLAYLRALGIIITIKYASTGK